MFDAVSYQFDPLSTLVPMLAKLCSEPVSGNFVCLCCARLSGRPPCHCLLIAFVAYLYEADRKSVV